MACSSGRTVDDGGGVADRDLSFLHRADQDGGSRFAYPGGSFDVAFTDVEKTGGLCLAEPFANWRKVGSFALAHGRQSRRDHGPLALAEMPAVKVQTDDKGGRIAAVVDPVGRQHGGEPAGEVTVAPVENATLAVEPDGLSEAMAANVVDEAVEVGAGHHRKGLGDGMVGTEGFVQVRHQNGFSVPSVVDSASQQRRAYSQKRQR